MNSLPKTVTRQRRDCELNPGPSAPESSALTTRLPSHPNVQERAGHIYTPPFIIGTFEEGDRRHQTGDTTSALAWCCSPAESVWYTHVVKRELTSGELLYVHAFCIACFHGHYTPCLEKTPPHIILE